MARKSYPALTRSMQESISDYEAAAREVAVLEDLLAAGKERHAKARERKQAAEAAWKIEWEKRAPHRR